MRKWVGLRWSSVRKIVKKFDHYFETMLHKYDRSLNRALLRPAATLIGLVGVSLHSLSLFAGRAFFPRTDPGQFVINLKAPSGTRVEVTDKYVEEVEQIIRSVVPKDELEMIVSNIGITPDISAIYTQTPRCTPRLCRLT